MTGSCPRSVPLRIFTSNDAVVDAFFVVVPHLIHHELRRLIHSRSFEDLKMCMWQGIKFLAKRQNSIPLHSNHKTSFAFIGLETGCVRAYWLDGLLERTTGNFSATPRQEKGNHNI